MRFTSFFLAVLPLLVAAVPIEQAPAGAETLPDRYIVVLKPGATTKQLKAKVSAINQRLSTMSAARALGLSHEYDLGSLKGFAGHFDAETIADIAKQADVSYIERDGIMRTTAMVTQADVPYGLARISHKDKGKTNYVYDSSAGEGTYAYIIDTGVYVGHSQFEGRATWGANFAANSSDTDAFGHGTHVAGTIASTAYGISKKAQVIAVKVLGDDGSGSNSDVISGIQWAAQDMISKGRKGKSVANMSLGGSYSKAVNDAVDAAVKAGLFLAIAAGNDGSTAEDTSPASAPLACAVGAIDNTDAKASYSNFGSVLKIFAPGSAVLSTWIGGPNETKKISGTSMATPHVAGVAAYLLGLKDIPSTEMCSYLVSTALKDKVTSAGKDSPNLLLNNGNGL